MWPATGISASITRRIRSARFSPPSIFTTSAPASFMKRVAFRTASSGANVVRTVGHVGGEERVFHAAPDGVSVVKHFVDRDRKCVRVAEHGHGQGVADQNDVDGSLVDQARAGIVVRGQAGDGLMLKFLFAKGSDGNLRRGSPMGVRLTISSSAPPPWRIEPVHILDAAAGIVDPDAAVRRWGLRCRKEGKFRRVQECKTLDIGLTL